MWPGEMAGAWRLWQSRREGTSSVDRRQSTTGISGYEAQGLVRIVCRPERGGERRVDVDQAVMVDRRWTQREVIFGVERLRGLVSVEEGSSSAVSLGSEVFLRLVGLLCFASIDKPIGQDSARGLVVLELVL